MHNNNNSLPGGWRSNDPSFKSNHQKEGGGGGYKNKASGSAMEEKIPEWLNDGPKSMHDMIELRGFDEDSSKNTKYSMQNAKDNSVCSAHHGHSYCMNGINEQMDMKKGDLPEWRHSAPIASDMGSLPAGLSQIRLSDDNGAEILSQSTGLADNGNSLSSLPSLNGKLPNTDAEFAAIVGILGDADLDSLKEVSVSSFVLHNWDFFLCSQRLSSNA
ncbi:unnamed protein product [Gongylonema pulchrum]|uniref:Ovule protein n=1 Tax=Gongylonema pulchrum TaxID=637853 RepID=A0A183EP76_9BILA|nr:unnamed protein product [Gongylonema pulchrum]